MQPYLFPYIGYFQLIKAVDTFVVYDDVNYIKRGWINRNRILLNGKDLLFTLQLKDASQFKPINSIIIGSNKAKIWKTIVQAYKKAPYFSETEPVLREIFSYEESNLARFITYSLGALCGCLDIHTPFLISSEIPYNRALKGEERIIEICRTLKAYQYINAIGGRELYKHEHFQAAGMELHFIRSMPIEYRQFDAPFVPGLSIIDVMMFNSREQIGQYLDQYELI